MPIYEYQCAACGHRYDHLQRLSDPDPTDCPNCGASDLKRRVSAPSFRLSGSGWYETDFKSDKQARRNIAGDDSAAPAASDVEPVAKDAAKDAAKGATKDVGASRDSPAAKPASSEPAKTPPASAQPSTPSS